MNIRYINKPDKEHLEKVKKEMKEMGSPVIHVLDNGDEYIALEGSHRLHAAKEMGIKPIFKIVNENAFIKNHDVEDLPKKVKASELGEYAMDSRLSMEMEDYDIDEDDKELEKILSFLQAYGKSQHGKKKK